MSLSSSRLLAPEYALLTPSNGFGNASGDIPAVAGWEVGFLQWYVLLLDSRIRERAASVLVRFSSSVGVLLC